MKFTDRGALSGVTRTAEGYLHANVRAVRTGIQMYTGDEMGRPDMDVVAVYRPEGEVFAKHSLNTFASIPVTLGHPPEMVDADNWKVHAKGNTGEEVLRDGEFMKIGIKITDRDLIDAVEAGTRQISAGYMAEIDWQDGVAPDGTPYQAIQRNIEANHIAVVDEARAGSKARIGDDAQNWGASPVTDAENKEVSMPDLRTIMVDGLQVETTDAGAAAIEKLQKAVEAKDATAAKVADEHKAALNAKDKEIAAKDAEIDKLKGEALTDAEMDRRVAERAGLVQKAEKLVDAFESKGSNADIRKAVVAAKIGDEAVNDRSDAYIEARFDALVEAMGDEDPVAGAIKDGQPAPKKDDPYSARDKRLNDGWKAKKEAA